MARNTTHVRVAAETRWALKIAGAQVDCSIMELLRRVERGDLEALSAWQKAARYVARGVKEK